MAAGVRRDDRVVPIAMERIPDEMQFGHPGIVDLDPARVGVGVECGAQPQALGRGRAGDQVDDGLQTFQGAPAPVAGDVAEHPVLDLVPFAGAGG